MWIFVWFRWTFIVEWSFVLRDCVTIVSFHLVLFVLICIRRGFWSQQRPRTTALFFLHSFFLHSIIVEYSLNIPFGIVVIVCLFLLSLLRESQNALIRKLREYIFIMRVRKIKNVNCSAWIWLFENNSMIPLFRAHYAYRKAQKKSHEQSWTIHFFCQDFFCSSGFFSREIEL